MWITHKWCIFEVVSFFWYHGSNNIMPSLEGVSSAGTEVQKGKMDKKNSTFRRCSVFPSVHSILEQPSNTTDSRYCTLEPKNLEYILVYLCFCVAIFVLGFANPQKRAEQNRLWNMTPQVVELELAKYQVHIYTLPWDSLRFFCW